MTVPLFSPIDGVLPDLIELLQRRGGLVFSAPPGVGKTTRVPIALLNALPPENGRVLVLEPRRLAAVAAARWMAHLLGEDVGQTVGYSIRFDRCVSEATRIEVVTEGILTRRIQADPVLKGVSGVIFDEFHERSIHTDLSLALCLDVRRRLRENLMILVMSATFDTGPIAALLEDAPVLRCEGNAFPVEVRYQPSKPDMPLAHRVAAAVRAALVETTGDVLIFLPGYAEIRACTDVLQPVVTAGRVASLHPLHGDLPFDEQERAICPSERRKIVLATNIAETSLTIEGVRVVIDSGLTRRMQHDSSTGMNRLITVPVSQASAEQRRGRAGRVAPGVCYRLFSELAFQSSPPCAPPEIMISDLAPLALDLAAWGVMDPSSLRWLDAPPARAWLSAVRLLKELNAIDATGVITSTGKAIARLPIHPRLGRMLIRAARMGRARLGAELAAILTERDIFRLPPSKSGRMRDTDITERLDTLQQWHLKDCVSHPQADTWALRAVDRTAKHLFSLVNGARKGPAEPVGYDDTLARLLVSAYPDRVGRRREGSIDRYVLAEGRGVRLSAAGTLSNSEFIVVPQVDAGGKAEGIVHMAAAIMETQIREECGDQIRTVRRVAWDSSEQRIAAAVDELFGAVVLSSKSFTPSDEEALPIICAVIKSTPSLFPFGREELQLIGRVAMMHRAFPDEPWPDLSSQQLASSPESWLRPYLAGVRSARDLTKIDTLAALRVFLTGKQRWLLDVRAPSHLLVPSGNMVAIDYAAGESPVLAVKLQELFGLAETPTIADGRVSLLLHLLSPAGRPVQVTRDLRAFWNTGYEKVRKELRGRYPKHPWPNDPWNAVPTRRTKRGDTRNG